MSNSSIYIRIKRHKTTYFVETTPQSTIANLKTHLHTLIHREREPKDLRLQTQGKAAGQYSPLDDTAVLEQVGVGEDAVLYLTYWIPGQPNPADGKWEPVEVPEFEPLNEEAEEEVPPASAKGKGVS
ncbi:hypothetical protein DFS34DRAFT_636220 [Phlyctochytrium arcticum]|nr:hypothetical protein DFS34DRAFT_636220 [Phlyctochytrium arcticum]